MTGHSNLDERKDHNPSPSGESKPTDVDCGAADFSHLDGEGRARMVDVGDKNHTERVARAEGWITVGEAVFGALSQGTVKKGAVLTVAEVAGIMGAKKTSELIPLCHPLPLQSVKVFCELVGPEKVRVEAVAKTFGQTGVEMEALTAVNVALLTIYDMCKAIEKGMVIGPVYLVEKDGGRSGHYLRVKE